jgi:hypothetical protein
MPDHPRYGLRLAAAVFASSLAATGIASAQSGRAPAGFVTAVEAPEREGRPGAILKREGQPIDLQIWTSLFDGDVIEVAAGSVTIETAKDKRLKVDATRSPHRIEGELPTAGRFSALASVVGDLFRQKSSRNSAALIGRTGAPEILLGGAAVQQVVSGQSLWVSWSGGSAPFTIDITGQSPKRNLDVRALASVNADTDSAMIQIPVGAQGKLTLVVRDALGREAKRELLTVPAPSFPDWVTAGAPTPEFAQVARALYLLEDKTGARDMMAATMAAQAGDYPAALNLRDMLAEGRKPE